MEGGDGMWMEDMTHGKVEVTDAGRDNSNRYAREQRNRGH